MSVPVDLINDQAIQYIAAVTHGEMRNQPEEAKLHVISSIVNRLGKGEWRGLDLKGLSDKYYYAVRDSKSGKNTGFSEAISGKFRNKSDESDFKKTLMLTSAVIKGHRQPYDTQFYFNTKEDARQKKAGRKVFDYSKVKSVGDFDAGGSRFTAYAYK